MKRRLSLVVIVLAAAALSMVGVLRDSTPGSARIPQPVRPVAQSNLAFGGLSSTALGVVVDARSDSGGNPGGHGIRGNTYTQYGADTYGNLDISVNDGDPLGFFLTTTDIGCNKTGPTNYDSVATTVSPTTPYTFDEASSDFVATGREYLLPQLAPYPVSAVFFTDIDNIWLLGGTLPYTLNPALPLNIATMQIPWMPGSAITQIYTGGGPGKPTTQTCSDVAGGVQVSETDGTATTPVGMTGNPELIGDSAAPCDPGATECADKQVHGFWAYPGLVTGASTTVTLRVLNSGPEATGDFKDVWHVEAPDEVDATWSGVVDADVVADPTVLGGGTAEISYAEDNAPVGVPVTYTGTLNVSCTTPGDYVVAIKAVAYPKAGTTDNDLNTNVSMAAVRVQCPADEDVVDKQAIILSARVSAISPTSETLNRPFGSGPEGENQDGEHVQLLVGDTATLTFAAATRNQSDAAAAGEEWLVAEAPDLVGDGTYDIGINWDDTSVSAVYGSEPANQTALVPDSVTCEPGGGMVCAGLEVELTEPNGPQILLTADMDLTCTAPGRYLVPVKLVDLPVGQGDSNIANNVTFLPVTVYCWGSTGDKAAADDGIDDNTGLYPRWTTRDTSGANYDLRKSVPPYPATGMPSDIGYAERWVEGDCYWFDADGAEPGALADGWITEAESRADLDMPPGIDDDGDCLADAAFAQPGRPVDEDDQPDDVDCPAIVYNEGKAGPFSSVVYDTAADMDCDGLLDGWEKVYGSNPQLADSDNDGASDFFELFMYTNPVNPDTDGDLVLDRPDDDYIAAAAGAGEGGEAVNADDNCPTVANPTQVNFDGARRINGDQIPGNYASNPDGDKQGDACDWDDDNDEVLDTAELTDGGAGRGPTDPYKPDSDGDRCLDGVELALGKDPNLGSGTGKCPATMSPASQTYWRGCHLNVPDVAVWPDFATYSGTWAEMDVDGDGIVCSLSSITDADSDNGTGTQSAAPDELIDIIEAQYYGTKISVKDSDGDGCDDWKEIIDMNGNRQAEVTDVMFIAKRAFGLIPASNSDPLLDIDKNGLVQTSDALMAAKNSVLVKPHAACSSEG